MFGQRVIDIPAPCVLILYIVCGSHVSLFRKQNDDRGALAVGSITQDIGRDLGSRIDNTGDRGIGKDRVANRSRK